ncbi:cytochrome bd-I ubiquinol oxidase subunit 2 apoprotein [Tistlia consotensis]|uniref:Cytochrome bd-I ubiquinol oxidase subunit 2 apoprotein n=1 Tax=Tistlia consotensis USBA 355 TaxID=560819 RepID=A0A1Y6C611_9PROT|nr:cytochrome d ubiquinol oxidase subunit II [Tistlia consotensis]SMF43780.1 cytochrome bd-I ubiquinol oxidase subunit 2 apoprotein [Tistlia consotensis USBA 355]SNR42921.1 cytochrome bd-I ubiquinol oxidase subunit 2 apoprotein [Tistlia consotensis]
MHLPIDYETLRLIWWLFLGVLLIGFAIMDGFDLGVGMLLPVVARSDLERRVMLNAIGPVWDGNQVWLILGGGAVFAAFPTIYATAFSGFYLAMFLTLLALILRPVGFDFRNKLQDRRWRAVWDTGLFIAGFVPALVFGVAFGNLLQGVPFSFDADLRVTYDGGLLGLLNPFGLLAGLLSVAMLAMHGAAYLVVKTEGEIQARARRALRLAAPAAIALFVVAGLWVAWGLDGYVIASAVDGAGPSNPLAKEVARVPGAWLDNYGRHPWMLAAPLLGLGGAALAWLLAAGRRELPVFLATAASVLGIVATAGVSLFPFLMPSSLEPKASLTVWDASSSQFTLFVMLIATVIFLPIVLLYTGFVFRVLRGKVTAGYVEKNSSSLY